MLDESEIDLLLDALDNIECEARISSQATPPPVMFLMSTDEQSRLRAEEEMAKQHSQAKARRQELRERTILLKAKLVQMRRANREVAGCAGCGAKFYTTEAAGEHECGHGGN